MPTLDQHQSSDYTKPSQKRGTLAERFRNYCGPQDQTTGCIPWLASRNRLGYGQIQSGGRASRPMLAHRVAWLTAGFPLYPSMDIMHLCNNPCCVNIEHLAQGTHKQNMEDAGRDGLMKGPRRFTAADYSYIKRKVAEGTPKNVVASMVGCSPALVTKVLNGSLKNADAR